MATKATAEYNAVLDKVESKAKEIAAFVKEHPVCLDLLELINEYNEIREDAGKAVKSITQATGSRSFVSSAKGATARVDLRQDIDGDALIRDHGTELLNKNPRALKIVKSEYNKFPLENVDLSKYLESPTFVATVTSTDKEVKAIVESMKYLMECHQIDAPEHADDIESWYAIYDTLKRVEY